MANTKTIELSNGGYAAVDASDYDWLSRWKWRNKNGYAIRNGSEMGEKLTIFMHRVIACTPTGMQTDHIDGNRLNNTRANLRICTASQNQQNRRPDEGGSSKFKGVTWAKHAKRWRAQITIDYKCVHLGYFISEAEAAAAYTNTALELFGEYARVAA